MKPHSDASRLDAVSASWIARLAICRSRSTRWYGTALTSPPVVTAMPESTRCATRPMPERLARSPDHKSSVVAPSAEREPVPVITTRRSLSITKSPEPPWLRKRHRCAQKERHTKVFLAFDRRLPTEEQTAQLLHAGPPLQPPFEALSQRPAVAPGAPVPGKAG